MFSTIMLDVWHRLWSPGQEVSQLAAQRGLRLQAVQFDCRWMIVLNPELKSMNHNPKVLSSEAKSLVLKSLIGRRTCDQSHVVSQYLIEESSRFPTAPHRTTTRITTRTTCPLQEKH